MNLDDQAILDHLAHYGVKGMKWGVRKKARTATNAVRRNAGKQVEFYTENLALKAKKEKKAKAKAKNASGLRRSKPPPKVSTERKRAQQIDEKRKKHGLQALTNKEIADFNKRIELEKRASQLTQKPKRKNPVKEGHNFVRDILAIGVTVNAVIAFSKTPAGRALAEMLKKSARNAAKKGGGPKRASAEIVRLALPAGHSDLLEDFLEHYGVKGMRWGVRKGRDHGDSGPGASTGFLGGAPKDWPRNDALSGKKSLDKIMSDVVPQINPGYPKGLGTQNNCRRCTFAYEMARRGYDVKATKSAYAKGQHAGGVYNILHPELGAKAHKTKEGLSMDPYKLDRAYFQNERVKKMYNNPEIETEAGRKLREVNLGSGEHLAPPAKFLSTLSRQPNGARGEVAVSFDVGFKHSMAYEVINKKAVIIDTQSGKTYTSIKQLNDHVGGKVVESGFTRLDNRQLNEEFIKKQKWVVPK